MVTGTLWPHLAQGIETDSAPENVVMVLPPRILRRDQCLEFDDILAAHPRREQPAPADLRQSSACRACRRRPGLRIENVFLWVSSEGVWRADMVWSRRVQEVLRQPVVQVIAADELTANVASDASRPRTAGMSRCDDEIVVSRRRTTPMSTPNVARTAATRPCSPRGVPIPIR